MKNLSKIIYLFLFGLIVFPQVSFGAECDLQKLSPINYRERSETVKNIQTCLKGLGYNISQATGYYGQETMKAIKSYYEIWYGKWNGFRLGNQGIEKLRTFLTARSGGDFSYLKFASNSEFLEYIKNASSLSYEEGRLIAPTMPTSAPTNDAGTAQEKSADRYSSTNTQVLSIDEPDTAKTNGSTIFYEHSKTTTTNNTCPDGAKCIVMPLYGKQISIIKALPAESISKESTISLDQYYYNSGNLLLNGNVLTVLEGKKIKGFDVSDTKNPKEKWTIELEDNTSVSDARLKDGKIYLITKSYSLNSCPVPLLKTGNTSISVNCSDIYYPNKEGSANTNYTVFAINPENGEITNKISMLGSPSSVIYMSENNLYITYNYFEDKVKYYLSFYKEKCSDIIPSSLIERIEKISSYDISNYSKLTEFNNEKAKYLNGLNKDENLRITNELNNRLKEYSEVHYRELEKTAIAKINLSNLSIISTGNIPGRLLNQFSLDEYNGNLRVATTIEQNFELGTTSKNDVYILNPNLNTIGSIKDLGKTERIYSVRFIGNLGYLVTFRQVDPFYVLDLSNPSNPQQKGELKIPGYSSYLHPIDDNTILGVGEENNKVKLSLFDVKNPSNPTEISKYSLDEYWTEVNSNHHAFLIDKNYSVFFIPASNGGYILSYKNNNLTLAKAIAGYNVKRAIYINDNLYILGDSKITVLSEKTWQQVSELELK